MRPTSIVQQAINMQDLLQTLQEQAPHHAIIREEACIGCTKCIQACPVDAIIGAINQMHSIITSECIGCRLCVDPCPVDCIDMLPAKTPLTESQQMLAQKRYQSKQLRALKAERERIQYKEKIKQLYKRKAAVKAALKRYKEKKRGRQSCT